MACETFVKEFQSENVSLHHENPSDFLRSQVIINKTCYFFSTCLFLFQSINIVFTYLINGMKIYQLKLK